MRLTGLRTRVADLRTRLTDLRTRLTDLRTRVAPVRAALPPLAVALAVSLAVPAVVGTMPAAAAPSGGGPGPAAAPAGTYSNPLTPDNAPDPNVVFTGGVYYAFTTGGTYGHIQEFHSTDLTTWTPAPAPGPLVQEPGWVNPGLEWAPSVAQVGGTWIMYYATFDELLDAECVTLATSASVAGPYVNNSAGPLVCTPTPGPGGWVVGGDIDPSFFADTAAGSAGGAAGAGSDYLLWKANPAGFQAAATIWSRRLAPDGLGFAPGSRPHQLTQQDQHWETTVENPQMVEQSGAYYLFYSGGSYLNATYAVGYAACAGPTGPCAKPLDRPLLSSAGPVVGPGGEWAFQDTSGQWWMGYAAWTAGAVGYPQGARSLRMDPLCFVTGGQGGPGAPVVTGPTVGPQPLAQSCPTTDPSSSYRLVAADGGLFAYGGAPFLGSTAAQAVPAPIVGMAGDPATGGYWEVGADGSVYPFGAPAEGSLAGVPLASPVVGMAATSNGQGYWLVAADGGVFAFGDAGFFGSAAGLPLDAPVVGMAPTPDGGGYWLVAADGGVFAFGDATYHGSMGGRPLNRPIVGMAANPAGGGYWLVASDGGVFSFGDAPFRGSTGALTLNRPIVGMAVDGPGAGYWLVASDGGVFAFGAARFLGSTGGMVLNRPVVGIAPA